MSADNSPRSATCRGAPEQWRQVFLYGSSAWSPANTGWVAGSGSSGCRECGRDRPSGSKTRPSALRGDGKLAVWANRRRPAHARRSSCCAARGSRAPVHSRTPAVRAGGRAWSKAGDRWDSRPKDGRHGDATEVDAGIAVVAGAQAPPRRARVRELGRARQGVLRIGPRSASGPQRRRGSHGFAIRSTAGDPAQTSHCILNSS